jgi:hypothetical protein
MHKAAISKSAEENKPKKQHNLKRSLVIDFEVNFT